MKKSLSVLCAVFAAAWFSSGCSTSTESGSNDVEPGKLAMPLKAVGSSGTEYRLRNAVFNVWGYPDDCWEGDEGCEYYEDTINGEDHLEEDSILFDVLKGGYEIYLNSGWQLERTVDGETEVVEAVLLNDNYQWVYVYPYSTSWVSFQFGIGDEELWFNGEVSINMDIYEDPSEYYWYGGSAGAGAAPNTGGAGGWIAAGGTTSRGD